MTPVTAGSARAALFLSVVLFVLAGFERWPARPSCPCPSESVAEGPWSRVVRCSKPESDGLSRIQPPVQPPIQPPVQTPVQTGRPVRGPARLLFRLPIDLRHADETTLTVLPGIGEARARQIVALRSSGALEKVSDLIAIRGIGPKTLEKFQEQVAVDYADACALKRRAVGSKMGLKQ